MRGALHWKGLGLQKPRPGRFLSFSQVVLLAVMSANLPATPLQHPQRLVNTYTVNLTPLFKWWTKHEGPRPLSSWVHITGSIVGTNAAGWILEAQVEGREPDKGTASQSSDSVHGQTRIILRSPPLEDLAAFESLNAELKTANEQRSTLAAEQSRVKAKEQAVAEQQHNSNGARSRLLAVENRQLKAAEDHAKAEQKPLDERMKEIQAKLSAYPKSDHYVVDCFALDMQYEFDRLPVYDHGRVLR
jgi:hypothetical protein